MPVDLPGWVSVPLGGSFGAGSKGTVMAIAIDRDQRDGMYQEVLLDLHGLTDLWTEFDAGNFGLGRAASNAKVAARSGHSRRSR